MTALDAPRAVDRYAVEFIGTFFLALLIATAVLGGSELAPVAVGTGLTALVFAGGHVSGAHYNPVVTLAFWLRGRCPRREVAPYVGAQVVAAVLGALAGEFVVGDVVVTAARVPTGPALLAEFLFTFLLVFVILNVADARGTAGNPFYGIAIGFTVLAGAFAVGTVSGAAFNPAIAVAAMGIGLLSWGDLWIYLLANVGGALAATVVFTTVVTPLDVEPDA